MPPNRTVIPSSCTWGSAVADPAVRPSVVGWSCTSADPQVGRGQQLRIRGIAWAGQRDADLLVAPEELAALAYPPGGPIAPEHAKETLELHPDFEISLVASEPLVAKPISIEWDARGRMWVAQAISYPDFAELRPSDRISILEDRDSDGRMDSETVFDDKLDLVTSFVFHENGAIVELVGGEPALSIDERRKWRRPDGKETAARS